MGMHNQRTDIVQCNSPKFFTSCCSSKKTAMHCEKNSISFNIDNAIHKKKDYIVTVNHQRLMLYYR